MTSFSVVRKKTPFQKHREEEEAKKKREDDEAARLYEEFVQSFNVPGGKAFVRGETINPNEHLKSGNEGGSSKDGTSSTKKGSRYLLRRGANLLTVNGSYENGIAVPCFCLEEVHCISLLFADRKFTVFSVCSAQFSLPMFWGDISPPIVPCFCRLYFSVQILFLGFKGYLFVFPCFTVLDRGT